jgi:hypothetical protein
MYKKLDTVELLILIASIFVIFLSEYYYFVANDHDRAIFIGLWPPTMLILLMYINSKKVD